MRFFTSLFTTVCASTALVAAQQIFDVVCLLPLLDKVNEAQSIKYTTTFDQKSLFAHKNLGDAGSSPINFVAPGPGGAATISVDVSFMHLKFHAYNDI
jgi:hypothetical protein